MFYDRVPYKEYAIYRHARFSKTLRRHATPRWTYLPLRCPPRGTKAR